MSDTHRTRATSTLPIRATRISSAATPYVESVRRYLANPTSVPDNWREYFLQNVPAVDGSNAKDVRTCRSSTPSPTRQTGRRGGGLRRRPELAPAHRRAAAHRGLPQRRRPLGRPGPSSAPSAHIPGPRFYGFTDAVTRRCSTPATPSRPRLHVASRPAERAARLLRLSAPGYNYICRTRWWQEKGHAHPPGLQRRKKHPGAPDGPGSGLPAPSTSARRFSLEGGELHRLDGRAGAAGGQAGIEIVIGCIGRLNVLVNTWARCQGPVRRVRPHRARGPAAGDVKYQGFSSDVATAGGRCTSRPSAPRTWKSSARWSGLGARPHGPRGDPWASRCWVLVRRRRLRWPGRGHGNLALAETLATPPAARCLVINNQIGPTSDPRDNRSTHCSDIVKMIESCCT